MSQAKCQALIQSKCGPGERGFVTVYDDSLKGKDGRERFVDEDGISMRVAEAFTSLNHSPNAPAEQRRNRVVVRVPYRSGGTVTRSNGDVRASEALATEAAFAQLFDLLSKPAAAASHPAEAMVVALKAENEALRAELAKALGELDESHGAHAAKSEEVSVLRARVAELEAAMAPASSPTDPPGSATPAKPEGS